MRLYFLSKGLIQTLNLRHLRVALSWSIEYVPFSATLSLRSSSVFWNSQRLMFHWISLTSFSGPSLFTPNAPTTTQSPSQPLGPESPGAASISWLWPEGLRGIRWRLTTTGIISVFTYHILVILYQDLYTWIIFRKPWLNYNIIIQGHPTTVSS